jgi:hypothetical protein
VIRSPATETRIALSDRAGWEEALLGVPHAFGHTWESCEAMHLTTGWSTFLYCCEIGTVRVVCPLAERPVGDLADIVTPYGFSGFAGTSECPQFPEIWSGFVKRQRYVCGYLSLHPLLTRPTYFQPGEAHVHASVFIVDLGGSADVRFRRLDRNRRRELQRFAAGRTRIVEGGDDLARFFVAGFKPFMESKGANATYRLTSDSLAHLCEADNTLLLGIVAEEGDIQAASLFGYTRYGGESLFTVSIPGGHRYTTSLIWSGMERLAERGVPTLNLGGGITHGDGVAAYKTRFRPRELPLVALRQVYRPGEFAGLCRTAGVDTEAGDYFPPYRAPGGALLDGVRASVGGG